MSDDLINRQDAINAICEDGTALERQGRYSLTMAERKQRDADILEALPSAQQWIPCSERLPGEEKAYLVTFANEKVGMSSWHKDTLYNRGFDAYLTGITEDGECEYFGVVAWMEKPEPWKGEQE